MADIVIDSITALEAAEIQEFQHIATRIARNSTYGAINRVSARETTITNVAQQIESPPEDTAVFVESLHPSVKVVQPTYEIYEAIINRSKEDSINLFLALEQKCVEAGPLYIKDFDQSELFQFKGFEDFLIDFVLERNYSGDSYAIITHNNDYTDTCQYQRNRSLADLYRIVLSYYPGTSILDVARTLITGPLKLQMLYCPHISKIVFLNRLEKSYGSTFKHELDKWQNGYHKKSDSLGASYYVFKVKDSIHVTDYANLLD